MYSSVGCRKVLFVAVCCRMLSGVMQWSTSILRNFNMHHRDYADMTIDTAIGTMYYLLIAHMLIFILMWSSILIYRRSAAYFEKRSTGYFSSHQLLSFTEDRVSKDTLIIVVAAALVTIVVLLSIIIVIAYLKCRRTSEDKEAITKSSFDSSSLDRPHNAFENSCMTEREVKTMRSAL